MSMYCRITGKSRGLPKPNYFPLLPPISPADAKKLCRITGKAQGLPASHQYIPIPLVPKKKSSQNCPITGKSVGQPQHHFIPELPANYSELRHQPISGYRYVVPVLDNPPPLLQDLLCEDVLPDCIAAQYVYTLDEKRCGIVLPANLEAAVRQGKVSGMSLSDNSDRVSFKFLEGKQITVKVVDMKPQPIKVSDIKPQSTEVIIKTPQITEVIDKKQQRNEVIDMKSKPIKIIDKEPNMTEVINKTPQTTEVNDTKPQKTEINDTATQLIKVNDTKTETTEIIDIKSKITEVIDIKSKTTEGINNKLQPTKIADKKSITIKNVIKTQDNFIPLLDGQGPTPEALEKRRKVTAAKAKKKDAEMDSMKRIFEDKEIKAEKAALESIVEKKPKIVPPVPIPEPIEAAIIQVNGYIKEPIPTQVLETPQPIITQEVIPIKQVKSIQQPVKPKPDIKIAKKTIKEAKSNGAILKTDTMDILSVCYEYENNREEEVTPITAPIIVPQTAHSSVASEPGVIKNKKSDAILRATINLPPLTCTTPPKPTKAPVTSALKSVWDIAKQDQETQGSTTASAIQALSSKQLDKIVTLQDILKLSKNIEKGTETELKWGKDILKGKNIEISKNKLCFVPGLNINGNFIAGQTLDNHFIAGLTVKTGTKIGLIPGCVMKEEGFIAGINKEGKFIPGQIFNTGDKEEFIPGQTIMTPEGPRFIPGQFVKEKFVPGSIVNTSNGPQFIQGQSTNSGEFRPGQVCYKSENGEPIFVSGQTVIENGVPKFIPGRTVSTPNGPQFVQGREVDDGRNVFVPGTSESNEFIPSTAMSTRNGEQFAEGRFLMSTDGKTCIVPGTSDNNGFKPDSKNSHTKKLSCEEDKTHPVVYGHMIQMDTGVQFYPEGITVPTIGVTRSIPGQLANCIDDDDEPRFIPGMKINNKFIAGQMVRTNEGTKFVPGQLVKNKDGAKFVPGQTLEDGQFVPGQVVDDKFVPGQIVQTAAGPTFIPGQVMSTLEEGSRFVPGRVVETSDGPRFAPGRVIDDGHGGVAFIPGRIVETGEGPCFVAPDLESTPDGTIRFSMQSFEVSPEELQLIDQTNSNNTDDAGSIDSTMLDQLARAGITLAQKNLPDVYVCPVKNLHEIATHITDRLKLPEAAQAKMALVLQKVAELGHIINNNNYISTDSNNTDSLKPKYQSQIQIQAYDLIESAITAAVTTASKDISLNPDEAIIQEMSSVLEDILPNTASASSEPFADYLLTALYEIVTSDAKLEAISCSVQQGLKRPVANKVEVLKDIVNKTENLHDTVAKISKVLRKPKSHLDIGKAFKRLSAGDPELVDLVVSKVGLKVDGVNTDKQAAHTLQNSIVSAVRESSERQMLEILDNTDQNELKHLILQAIGLARALGLHAAAEELLILLKDSRIASALATDHAALEILQRLTLMKKLSENRPAYAQALGSLNTTTYKEDTRYLKQLVRESEALLTAVQEEEDSYASDDDDDYSYSNSSFNSTFDDEIISRVPRRINSSNDISAALFHALVDCQKQPQLLKRLLKASDPDRRYTYDHACVILKNKTQAVIPKESARSVLTGKASYTLIDEKGVTRFGALDVFSALKIDKPIALKKFSMYSAGLESTWVHAPTIDEDDSLYIAGSSMTSYANTPGTMTPGTASP